MEVPGVFADGSQRQCVLRQSAWAYWWFMVPETFTHKRKSHRMHLTCGVCGVGEHIKRKAPIVALVAGAKYYTRSHKFVSLTQKLFVFCKTRKFPMGRKRNTTERRSTPKFFIGCVGMEIAAVFVYNTTKENEKSLCRVMDIGREGRASRFIEIKNTK
jgi:hypothetical protein